VLIIFSKHDSCTKPEPLIEPRHLLFSLALDEKRTSSNTSTWLLYTCTSESLGEVSGIFQPQDRAFLSCCFFPSSPPSQTRRRGSQHATGRSARRRCRAAPPGCSDGRLRRGTPSARPIQAVAEYWAGSAGRHGGEPLRPAAPSSWPLRQARTPSSLVRPHACPAAPSGTSRHPPQKAVRLGRRVVCSLPNPRCSPDMALCSSHRAACDAQAHLCTCNHVTLMHNPALPKCSLYQLACCQTKHQCSIPLPPTNLRQIWATQSTSAESSAALSSPREDHKTLDANVLEWTSNEEGNRKRM